MINMNFTLVHSNYNVFDLEKSIAFYQEALNLQEASRKEASDGSFILVYMKGVHANHEIELTWLRDRTTPYNLGDNETHIAFRVDDYDKAYAHHKQMDCIVYENTEMGLYFISDPDGYWIEIYPWR